MSYGRGYERQEYSLIISLTNYMSMKILRAGEGHCVRRVERSQMTADFTFIFQGRGEVSPVNPTLQNALIVIVISVARLIKLTREGQRSCRAAHRGIIRRVRDKDPLLFAK